MAGATERNLNDNLDPNLNPNLNPSLNLNLNPTRFGFSILRLDRSREASFSSVGADIDSGPSTRTAPSFPRLLLAHGHNHRHGHRHRHGRRRRVRGCRGEEEEGCRGGRDRNGCRCRWSLIRLIPLGSLRSKSRSCSRVCCVNGLGLTV